MGERRNDIDWLRIIAMLSVFVFHCTRFFDTEDWHLKNAQQSGLLFLMMRALVWPWVMELFFLVSGVGAWYLLRSKTAGEYLRERVKRLLIPLYTVGLFILLPLQFYFDQLTKAGYSGTFLGIIPHYFRRLGLPRLTQSPSTLVPLPFSGHLWFLQYLLLISLMVLPLLLWLKADRGQRVIATLAEWSERRGGLFLFVIPLALSLIALRGLFEAQRSWADFLWYAIYFIIGYVMAADQRFIGAFKRQVWVCLVLWLVAFFGGLGLLLKVFAYTPSGQQSLSAMYVLYQTIWSISSWSAVVFMLSIGARYLKSYHKALDYGNEAVLPFYLFHQTIILGVGFFVIPWHMSILPKFLIIAAISFPLIGVLYVLLVRPFEAMRFFFGMRPKKKPLEPRPSDPVVIAA